MITGKRVKQLGDGTCEMPGQKAYEMHREPSRLGLTYSNGRQLWLSGWIYVPYLRYVQGRQGMKEGGGGGRCGGAKR